jgi:S-adenosylmethionine uptake transporter
MRAGPALSYLAGVFLFCVMNAILKHALETYPVVMANAWRYLFAAVFSGLFWWALGRPAITRAMLPLYLLRGAVIAVSAVAFFFAVTRLTLAETITLSFVAPLLVPPMARLFLNERLEARSVAAGALGFLGVLVAGGIGSAAMTPARLEGVAAALVSALTYAVATVLLRARAERDAAASVSLLAAIVPALLLFPAAAVAQGPLLPAAIDLPWFAAAGLCVAAGLWLFARALSVAEAQRMVPFEYSALAWMSLFGFLFFGESLSLRTVAGALLIIAACTVQAGRQAAPVVAR